MLSRRTFCVSIAAQLATQASGWAETVSSLMERGVAEARLPGALALIEDDGETIQLESRGWRDLTRRDPMTPTRSSMSAP